MPHIAGKYMLPLKYDFWVVTLLPNYGSEPIVVEGNVISHKLLKYDIVDFCESESIVVRSNVIWTCGIVTSPVVTKGNVT